MGYMNGIFLWIIIKQIYALYKMYLYKWCCDLTSVAERNVQVNEHEWTVWDFQAGGMDLFWENNGHLYSPFQVPKLEIPVMYKAYVRAM